MKTLSEGQYVTIKEDGYNRLIITATKEAWDLRARGELWAAKAGEWYRIEILLSDHFIDGWGWFTPSGIGAMVGDDCLIIGDEYRFDESGDNIVATGNLWYHERYATELFSEQVFAGGVMMLPVPVQEEEEVTE